MNALSPFGTRYPFHPYPTGWFGVAFSEDLGPKEVRQLKYFGRELVLFRTEGGKAVVADAHCPHLGAHLGYESWVEGDTIVCPFHQWRYNTEGKCVHVPFTKQIPPRARINTWPLNERDGIIFVWHDLDGRAPLYELPDFHQDYRPNAGFYALHDEFGGAHPQDIFENTVDFAHFPGVHGTGRTMSNGELQIDGHRFLSPIKVLDKGYEGPVEDAPVASTIMAEVIGGGLTRIESNSRMTPGLTMVTHVTATPVDETLTHYRMRLHLHVAPDCPLTDAQIDQINLAACENQRREQYSDGKIWPFKAYAATPMLSAADGPILKYREFYRQFHPRTAE